MSKSQIKSVSQSLKRIATLIEKDPKFLAELEKWLNRYEISNVKRGERTYKDAPLIDAIDVYNNLGSDGLRFALDKLEISELRKIIMQNSLDPSKLSNKWKNKEKMINFILERIAARNSKGNAFMNYGNDRTQN